MTRKGQIERLYVEERDRLWRAILAFCGDADVASDAVSEAFTQALARGEEIRDPLPWIWKASFRIASGELKRRGSFLPLTEETYTANEPAIDLIRALHSLPAKQRSAIILHYFVGYPAREIAKIIDSTAPAVRVHLSIGRNRLRNSLSQGESQ